MDNATEARSYQEVSGNRPAAAGVLARHEPATLPLPSQVPSIVTRLGPVLQQALAVDILQAALEACRMGYTDELAQTIRTWEHKSRLTTAALSELPPALREDEEFLAIWHRVRQYELLFGTSWRDFLAGWDSGAIPDDMAEKPEFASLATTVEAAFRNAGADTQRLDPGA